MYTLTQLHVRTCVLKDAQILKSTRIIPCSQTRQIVYPGSPTTILAIPQKLRAFYAQCLQESLKLARLSPETVISAWHRPGEKLGASVTGEP